MKRIKSFKKMVAVCLLTAFNVTGNARVLFNYNDDVVDEVKSDLSLVKYDSTSPQSTLSSETRLNKSVTESVETELDPQSKKVLEVAKQIVATDIPDSVKEAVKKINAGDNSKENLEAIAEWSTWSVFKATVEVVAVVGVVSYLSFPMVKSVVDTYGAVMAHNIARYIYMNLSGFDPNTCDANTFAQLVNKGTGIPAVLSSGFNFLAKNIAGIDTNVAIGALPPLCTSWHYLMYEYVQHNFYSLLSYSYGSVVIAKKLSYPAYRIAKAACSLTVTIGSGALYGIRVASGADAFEEELSELFSY